MTEMSGTVKEKGKRGVTACLYKIKGGEQIRTFAMKANRKGGGTPKDTRTI